MRRERAGSENTNLSFRIFLPTAAFLCRRRVRRQKPCDKKHRNRPPHSRFELGVWLHRETMLTGCYMTTSERTTIRSSGTIFMGERIVVRGRGLVNAGLPIGCRNPPISVRAIRGARKWQKTLF
jgi:hypothetical protein